MLRWTRLATLTVLLCVAMAGLYIASITPELAQAHHRPLPVPAPLTAALPALPEPVTWLTRRSPAPCTCSSGAEVAAAGPELSMPQLRRLVTCHDEAPSRASSLSPSSALREWAALSGEVRSAGRGRALVYSCSGSCGGLGDRLRAIVTMFWLAFLSHRALFIHSPWPVPLQEALLPHEIDWRLPGWLQGVAAAPLALVDRGEEVKQVLEGVMLGKVQEQHVALATNFNGLSLLRALCEQARALRGGGLGRRCAQAEQLQMSSQVALDALFRPSPELRRELAALMSSTRVWESSPVVCGHVRSGQADSVGQGVRWSSEGSEERMVARMLAAQRELEASSQSACGAQPGQRQQSRMLVVSDDPEQAERLNRLLQRGQAQQAQAQHRRAMTFVQPAESTLHVDKAEAAGLAGNFVTTFAQMLLLSLCDGVVLGLSGFARIPVLWADMPPGRQLGGDGEGLIVSVTYCRRTLGSLDDTCQSHEWRDKSVLVDLGSQKTS